MPLLVFLLLLCIQLPVSIEVTVSTELLWLEAGCQGSGCVWLPHPDTHTMAVSPGASQPCFWLLTVSCIQALRISVLGPGQVFAVLGFCFLTVVGFLVSLCFQMNFSISFSIGTKRAHSDFNFLWVESTDHHRGRRWPNPTERSDFDHKSCISH